MPTNYTLPNQGAYTFSDYIGINAQDNGNSIFPSVLQGGGYQEMPTIQDRNEIGIGKQNQDSGFGDYKISGDGWGTGRRRVGMLVYVMSEQKLYQLIPNGYFGNNGSLGVTEWMALTDVQKFELLAPEESYNASFSPIPPPTGTYTEGVGSGNGNECWVELPLGGDNTYNSNLTPTLEMTEDIGGMPSGTLVSDLSGIKTYDELFDTILFPTSYPTASGPSVGLSLNPPVPQGLKVIGETYTGNLQTTANQGSITLNGVNQGVRSGDVTAATIAGPGGPYTLGVTAPNGIDDQALAHVVTLGSNSWTLTGTFAQGPVPQDSTGQPYTAVQYNGGTKQNSTSFEGVYPYFLGTSAGEDQFTERALISFSSNNVECLQDYPEDAGLTGNPVLNHRILVPLSRSAGAITIQVFNPNGSGAAAWPDNTSFWTEGPQVQRAVGSVFNQVDYRVFTKDGSSGGSNNYRLVF